MQRILVITLSNIGDAIMTTPVLAALHDLYPHARVDLVSDRRSQALFAACPFIDHIFLKHKKEGLPGVFRLLRTLRETRYDLVVDLRTDGLACLLKSERRLWRRPRRPHGPHAVEQHLSVIAPLFGEHSLPGCTLWLDTDHRRFAEQTLAEGKRWLGLGPGANWDGKIWQREGFLQLANQLGSQFDGFVLLGGPGDQEVCEWLGQRIESEVIDLCAKTDLLQAAAVMERLAGFIGNDSGLGHMAAAMQTPVLTVFGPGRPERYHPWGQRVDWIIAPNRDLKLLDADVVAKRLLSLVNHAQH